MGTGLGECKSPRSNGMAVKQKNVDCITPSTTEARLQRILRTLREYTAQGYPEKMSANVVQNLGTVRILRAAQGYPENVSINVVTNLGTIQVPTDTKSYVQFMQDIRSVQEILQKDFSRNSVMMHVMLKTLYAEISEGGETVPSPAQSIVLQLVPKEQIPRAVESLLQSSHQPGFAANQGLKNALRTLCIWLTKWTATENLGPVVLALMQGLENQQQYEVLIEVTMLTLEPLFKLLILPELRKSVGPIVLYMLTLTMQHQCAEVFQRILPHMKQVANCLDKENTESSLFYMRETINLCLGFFKRYPEYKNLNVMLMNTIQPFLMDNRFTPTVLNDNRPYFDRIGEVISSCVQSISGRVGLNNLGNTCYMNSVLQALFMTKTFRNRVLLRDYHGDHAEACSSSSDLFSKVQVLFALLQHSKRPALSPNDILHLARPPGFTSGQQHDSSEFLGYLLDSLHEQEKSKLVPVVIKTEPSSRPSSPSSSSTDSGFDSTTTTTTTNTTLASSTCSPNNYSHISSNTSTNLPQISTLVQSVFGGRTVSVSRCGRCGTKSERTDNFRELQLSFPSTSTGTTGTNFSSTIIGGTSSPSEEGTFTKDSSTTTSTTTGSTSGGTTTENDDNKCRDDVVEDNIDDDEDIECIGDRKKPLQSVQALLNYYVQPEKLSDDNQYHCEVCRKLTDGERVTCIGQAPPRLILTLKHFRYDARSHQRTKLLQRVQLDNQVCLINTLGGNSNSPSSSTSTTGAQVAAYELYAAVIHSGSTLDSGHYYTYAKDGATEQWYKFNDCTVTKAVSSDELYRLQPSDTPYILFYSRVDCEEPEDLQRNVLSHSLQTAIDEDFLDFEAEKRKRRVVSSSGSSYNMVRRNNDHNDGEDPPPPGCGGSPFSNSSSNMYVC